MRGIPGTRPGRCFLDEKAFQTGNLSRQTGQFRFQLNILRLKDGIFDEALFHAFSLGSGTPLRIAERFAGSALRRGRARALLLDRG